MILMILNPNNNINPNNLPPNTHSFNFHNISKNTPNLSFATHNVNFLQCEIKNNSINNTFLDFNIDFIGLTKTRHKSNQFYHYTHDPNFCAFWSSYINVHAGVGILVKRS